jgi:hypothetical protein
MEEARTNVSLNSKPRPTATDSEFSRKETTLRNRKIVVIFMVTPVFTEGMNGCSLPILRPWNYIHGILWDLEHPVADRSKA